MIAALCSAILILAGCNQSEEQIVEDEDKNNPSTEEQREETEKAPEDNKKITEEVGLGDIRDLFTKAYEENKIMMKLPASTETVCWKSLKRIVQ
ncbi:hypothetical protein [Cytobacillus sp. BC1816]|uniref:hypothetical protein n=1 Tax=Cytobacillus sp. BC1816 TaxID=3440154 RepID=UPI003F5174B3